MSLIRWARSEKRHNTSHFSAGSTREHQKKTQWIGINQIIEDLAFEASVAMFIGLIEDLQVQGQQGQHLTFHI
ncbi:hypothetical protein M8J77_025490 [Diaphorina citri]|nr:hypothetical protein M8J77_025490 [Diaphorina citri]